MGKCRYTVPTPGVNVGTFYETVETGDKIFSSYAPISVKPVGGRPVIHGAFDSERLSTVRMRILNRYTFLPTVMVPTICIDCNTK